MSDIIARRARFRANWPWTRVLLSPIHFILKRISLMSVTEWCILFGLKTALYFLYRFLFLIHRTSPTPKAVDGSVDYTARFARRLFHILPLRFQFWMRDSGFMRMFMDGGALLGGVVSVFQKPHLLWEFTCNNHTRSIKYGPLKRHTLDIFHQGSHVKEGQKSPVIIFIHGGAWGSGFKAMYRLIGRRFDEEGFITVVPNYRVYPEADVHDQMRDVHKAFDWVIKNIESYGGDLKQIYLVGHSSGAQLSMLLLLKECFEAVTFPHRIHHHDLHCNIKAYIGMSAPMDIASHLLIEETRGLHTVSPMLPSNSPKDPFIWTEHHETTSSIIVDGVEGNCDHLELASPTHICRTLKPEHLAHLPPILVIHGMQDNTVPYASSIKFCQALVKAYKRRDSSSDMSGVADMKNNFETSYDSNRLKIQIPENETSETTTATEEEEQQQIEIRGRVKCVVIDGIDHSSIMTDLMRITEGKDDDVVNAMKEFISDLA